MNKILVSLMFSAFFATGIGYAQTQMVPAPGAAAVPAAMKPVRHAGVHHATNERHPELRKAMRKLKGAEVDLGKAASDFAGHKAKAIAAIKEALEELHAAIQSDK